MIITKERVIDPVEFLKAEPGILDSIEHGSSEVLSGADIDMRIAHLHTGIDPMMKGRLDGQVSRILGRLYMDGSVHGEEIGSRLVDIHWYPSPAHVNQLSERLNLTPGKDVLKFVHSEGHDQIPSRVYAEHLAAGEYPQSTGERYFFHDRDSDHAPGVLLTPPAVTDKIIRIADYHTHPAVRSRKQQPETYAGDFDRTSASIGRIASYLYGQMGKDFHDIELDRKNILGLLYLPATYFDIKKSGVFRASYKEEFRQIGETIFEHLQELAPRIEALKQEDKLVSSTLG